MGRKQKRKHINNLSVLKRDSLCAVVFSRQSQSWKAFQQAANASLGENLKPKENAGHYTMLGTSAKEKSWTHSSVYKMTGCRLHKTGTASGLWPHYSGHRARSRRISPSAVPSRQQADFCFHLEHYQLMRHVTFLKNLSQLCQQASPEKHTQTKTCGQPTRAIRPVWPQIWACEEKEDPDQRRQQTGPVQGTFP